MTEFRLQITVNGLVRYDGACTSLTVPLPDGLYGIQANHTPLFAAVKCGKIKYDTPDGECFFETKGAFLRFEKNTAVILARE
jgi:F-type H+-transporting ATPase subunit epsilon